MIVARWSRYVVDLNRSPDDGVLYPGQLVTGLCPEHTVAGDPIYRDSAPYFRGRSGRERVERYWRPYHERCARDAGRACAGSVTRCFGTRIPSGAACRACSTASCPTLNIGTYDGRAATRTSKLRSQRLPGERLRRRRNGRFKGGHITRHYGSPADNIEAIQLEIAQRSYMDKSTRRYDDASRRILRATLRDSGRIPCQRTTSATR